MGMVFRPTSTKTDKPVLYAENPTRDFHYHLTLSPFLSIASFQNGERIPGLVYTALPVSLASTLSLRLGPSAPQALVS